MAKAVPPTGKNFKPMQSQQSGPKGKISYHNGLVMSGAQDVYVIWYGDWSANPTAQTIVSDFISNLGGSAWYQINTRYQSSSGQGPSGALFFGGAAVDAYSHGTSLTDADVAQVVTDAIVN